MQSIELRERFLSFFEAQGHSRVPSDSLIPSGDTTVLFTSAGMNQFKEYFTGKRRDLKRAVSAQKCLRTADLDQVGRTPYHHSFFEMLGNFSFGDYFKKDAIQWAWEFLTGTVSWQGPKVKDAKSLCLDFPANRLWVSVYEEDQEAKDLWLKLGVPKKRIISLGAEDNFWPSSAPKKGPNGPCGPCSEIYYDPQGKEVPDLKSGVEIWNLVFTQFDRLSNGELKQLPKPNIDTGMGLERLTAAYLHLKSGSEGAVNNYDTDLFTPIIDAVRLQGGHAPYRGKRSAKQERFARMAIADHARAITLLIAEGLLPSNESRGYVLRMLIRRAHRLGRYGGGMPAKPFLAALLPGVEAAMKESPYAGAIAKRREVIQKVLDREESQFIDVLDAGTQRVEELIRGLSQKKGKKIPGAEAFKLYDTYGFPLEITADIAEEHGLEVDREGFESALAEQQKRSRSKSQFGGGVFVTDAMDARKALGGIPSREEQFQGYEELKQESRILGLWDGKAWIDSAREGQQVGAVLDHSPFYGESGGQAGDSGSIDAPKGCIAVKTTTWVDDVLVHQGQVTQGLVSVQEPVRAEVDANRRQKIARGHTATHMVHAILRKVLGPETVQAGSFVDADRLRFDFSSMSAMNEEQRLDVEEQVNARIALADTVSTDEMSLQSARQEGALAFFGEKYGSKVRVVSIGDYSKELCGGTHLRHTGYVGAFKIIAESSIAAGTRRIEAIVGDAAMKRQRQEARVLHEAAKRLGRPAIELAKGLEELLGKFKRSERERKALQIELAKVQSTRLAAQGKEIEGAVFVAAMLKQTDREILATMADAVIAALNRDSVVLLASTDHGQVAVVMAASKGLSKRVHVGQMIKAIAPIMGGSGGGRPEFAQGGGKNAGKLPEVFKRAEHLIREALREHK